ncbi:stress response translation initiation inhibitor YciH [Candidatus Micrarchaeota archaeon CG_4_10_14_0_2_um_filter_60_11]|nr:MAG: translation initiation factor [Candidatus Micrarchaeota archaeon CG1_02_60_51]PIN96498.1 MAG: stress response translation initiation inhibitor YciH [Candidatus Micrarchaeota archaeon CG10_big_fil_rev_8_21_14_0_10_60_32]PIO01870.1 MAG: stress response translation initiation inhibitor YciH [Candidatus Micrarchaeota archaeon CG09_land_8_20_14_0_10_60_16]PIY91536.1 MAG: stress response translation initiation inhibitor YciH [Candidatus Micrarchaeota archaeon CG_4_10_14_0_8_um_filter_60_7]PIZ
MTGICDKCGLPKEICACQTIEKETSRKLQIYTTKKRFNKLVTIVEGLEGEELKKVGKELKHALACGGTAKDGMIILQGSHIADVVNRLVKMGYPRELINFA